MKKLLFLLIAIAVLSAIGCGGDEDMGDEGVSTTAPPIIEPPTPDPVEPTYPDVRGNYSCTVTEVQNTCKCSGPRGQLVNPLPLLVEQNVNEATGPENWAYLSAPEGLYWTESNAISTKDFHIGGALSTSGNFTRESTSGTLTTLHYSSVFSEQDGAVNHQSTTEPYFLTIDFLGHSTEGDVCCNGEDGQAILTLNCPKM